MTRISKDEVRHVANLARLAVSEEEVEKFTQQLDSIISFAEQLNELDTSNVEPTSHVIPLKNVFRKDQSVKGLAREEVLKNAPKHKDGHIVVPSIMD
ncbi:Asp-tRNA(Asn)/Glu-tRNA(Gln) amidotransferase subunit GatC [Bacillus sp. 2205SS5-2]|uniref:Asp-tRNA(Asn)/Glu-tRNA(Gln) amidotransferase subunit GatC n=1 Tax=Bacillus sp. 2205SS5-2 TaxID=3109031 RepID=UPI0030055218